jgi:hypothetical protein
MECASVFGDAQQDQSVPIRSSPVQLSHIDGDLWLGETRLDDDGSHGDSFVRWMNIFRGKCWPVHKVNRCQGASSSAHVVAVRRGQAVRIRTAVIRDSLQACSTSVRPARLRLLFPGQPNSRHPPGHKDASLHNQRSLEHHPVQGPGCLRSRSIRRRHSRGSFSNPPFFRGPDQYARRPVRGHQVPLVPTSIHSSKQDGEVRDTICSG